MRRTIFVIVFSGCHWSIYVIRIQLFLQKNCIEFIIFSMLLLQKLKKLIYQSDMFCSSDMLRYNSETQYKTLTGGLFSISIFIFIVVGFASMIADTLNRTTISSTLQIIKQSDPPLSTLRTDKEHMFMFGVTIQSTDTIFTADLGGPERYFDIYFVLVETTSGNLTGTNVVPLEKCTMEHWAMLPSVSQRFDALGADQWLCPPLNMDIPMQGVFTSSMNYQVVVSVTPCSNSPLFDKPCAPQADIDNLMETYQNFYFTINYINPVISPTQPDHISYYLQTSDYVIFSNVIGSEAWIYFSDYTINTDNSIWPFEDNIVETGCIVEQKAVNHPYSVTPKTSYATMVLVKSLNSLVYTRIVQKISAVFSYIGGLVGAMTAVLFLLKAYTDSSLQITIGINLFNDHEKETAAKDKKSEIQDKPAFNFIKFMGLSLYQLLRSFGINKNWPDISKLQGFQRQIIHQLDVKMLLKRIIYLQTWMTYLFDEEQLVGLKFQRSISCDQAKRIRERVLHEKSPDIQEKEMSSENQSSMGENLDKKNKSMFKNPFSIEKSKKQSENNDPICESSHNYPLTVNNNLKVLRRQSPQTIPVIFIDDNNPHISVNKQSDSQKSSQKDRLDENSLCFLKELKKKAKTDPKSQKIWSNLRVDIQQIIEGEADNIEAQFYS